MARRTCEFPKRMKKFPGIPSLVKVSYLPIKDPIFVPLYKHLNNSKVTENNQ